jgi:hypothetical protein
LGTGDILISLACATGPAVFGSAVLHAERSHGGAAGAASGSGESEPDVRLDRKAFHATVGPQAVPLDLALAAKPSEFVALFRPSRTGIATMLRNVVELRDAATTRRGPDEQSTDRART